MTEDNSRNWQFNRQVNLSVLIQLVLLASLIVGSWVNLQRQLDLLQRDVSMLVDESRRLREKFESLSGESIAYDYRLRAVESIVKRRDSDDNLK